MARDYIARSKKMSENVPSWSKLEETLEEASDNEKGNACIYIQILGFLYAHDGQSIELNYFYSTYRN